MGLLPFTLLDGSFDNVCSFDVTCFQGDGYAVPDPEWAHCLQCKLTCNLAETVVLRLTCLVSAWEWGYVSEWVLESLTGVITAWILLGIGGLMDDTVALICLTGGPDPQESHRGCHHCVHLVPFYPGTWQTWLPAQTPHDQGEPSYCALYDPSCIHYPPCSHT